MFSKYYFQLLFRFQSRQGLLALAIFGLFLSSFSLLVLQSTMGGLQNKLIGRSKDISGTAYIKILDESESLALKVFDEISELGFFPVIEYRLELMLRYGNLISPIIVHGIDTNIAIPKFLNNSTLDELVVGQELAYKLNLGIGDDVSLISPGHVNSLMGDIPRFTALSIGHSLATDVTEIDQYHAWVRIGVIQNLIRKKSMNTIRLFGDGDFSKLNDILKKRFDKKIRVVTWEAENNTLVYALRLESIVMIFLFIAMTILVSFCITSGLMLFLSRMKNDLTSLWILGASENYLFKSCAAMVNILGLVSVAFGIIAGLAFLFLLDHYSFEIMPAVFVDRKIPVKITGLGLAISFIIPYLISLIFSKYSLYQFKKDTNHLEQVKSFS